MKNFEYKTLCLSDIQSPVSVEERLDDLGQAGWELVAIDYNNDVWFFKREIQ